jgi:quercetin dioxygenase-like cupin family protein
MPKQYSWDSVEVEVMDPLLTRQAIHTDKLTVARIVLQQGCVVPEHKHINEQCSQIVEGELIFYFPDREVRAVAGDVLAIASNESHRVVAVKDTVAIDTFTPPRQDWIDKDDAYPRTGSWSQAST